MGQGGSKTPTPAQTPPTKEETPTPPPSALPDDVPSWLNPENGGKIESDPPWARD